MEGNRTCPLCEQIVPRNVQQIESKGRFIHHGCAKEVSQLFFALQLKSNVSPPKKEVLNVAKNSTAEEDTKPKKRKRILRKRKTSERTSSENNNPIRNDGDATPD